MGRVCCRRSGVLWVWCGAGLVWGESVEMWCGSDVVWVWCGVDLVWCGSVEMRCGSGAVRYGFGVV